DETLVVNAPEYHDSGGGWKEITIGMTSDELFILWSQWANLEVPIWARRYDYQTGWDDITQLDGGNPYSRARQIDPLPGGAAVAIWSHDYPVSSREWVTNFSCFDPLRGWGVGTIADGTEIDWTHTRASGTMIVVDYEAGNVNA